MTRDELLELLEDTLTEREEITAVVRTGEDSLGLEDHHGVRHWITAEEL
ncbi:hypothetical protein ACIQMZ_37190 [Streptomyces longwoodensis]